MVSVDLYMSDMSGRMFRAYRFLGAKLIMNKSNGVQSMPIPATGDAPMLMNMSGMQEEVQVRFKIVDRDDNCGISANDFPTSGENENKIVLDNEKYLELTTSGTVYYYKKIYAEYSDCASSANGIGLCSDYNYYQDINLYDGQIAYLEDWLVTGLLGTYYVLVYEVSGMQIRFYGIPTKFRFDLVEGSRMANAEMTFKVGMVIV